MVGRDIGTAVQAARSKSEPHTVIKVAGWRQWLEHPERLLLRKALFQIHLWLGAAIGFYVVLFNGHSGDIWPERLQTECRSTGENEPGTAETVRNIFTLNRYRQHRCQPR